MFHTRVKSEAVGRRLDAGFYNPEYVAAQSAISRFPIRTMESLRADGAPIGYGVVKPRFQESSVRMVRIQDFSDPFVDLESSASIDPEQMTEFKRSACQAGDLLVAIGGYPGRLGLLPPLPDSVSAVNINQHVVRVRFAAGVERYFVTAFLMSSTGGKILARQVSGSVQAGINVEDFRLITVPVVGAEAQRYIGDKVRQSERLRERGRHASRAACELVDALIERRVSSAELVAAQRNSESTVSVAQSVRQGRPHSSAPDATRASRRLSRVTFMTMTAERMDASYYAPRFLENERFLASCGTPMVPIASLTEKCNCGSTPVDVAYEGSGVGLIRTTDVRPNTFLGHQVLRTSELRISPDSSVAAVADDLVYTMSGTVGYAAVVPPTDEVFSFSNTIVRARFAESSGQDPWFTAAFFNSTYGYTQSLRLVSGGIQGHVMPNPFKKLLVPAPDARAQKFLGLQFRFADECANQARGLVAAAKFLVEQLIDGRITEAELVAAQKALESGDRSADREILKALRQSDSHNAKPLISDVDALYALLDGPEVQDG